MMYYTATPTGYTLSLEYQGKLLIAGHISVNQSIEETYGYTDCLFHKNQLILRHCYLSDLKDNIFEHYSTITR